ncbi:MAG: hypothetical protein JWM37_395 [Candidatus Saccharibacteria bacterium]|nr:hypothetical protein [Candidatus Saccharibacteria bacterium]
MARATRHAGLIDDILFLMLALMLTTGPTMSMIRNFKSAVYIDTSDALNAIGSILGFGLYAFGVVLLVTSARRITIKLTHKSGTIGNNG